MIVSIALCLAAFRAGLALRRARAARRPPPRDGRRRHLRLAKPAVALILAGFLAGPASAVFLRDWTPFTSFHGIVGVAAAALFAAAAFQGHRLEGGRAEARNAHALLGALAVLLALTAAIAGFVLLP